MQGWEPPPQNRNELYEARQRHCGRQQDVTCKHQIARIVARNMAFDELLVVPPCEISRGCAGAIMSNDKGDEGQLADRSNAKPRYACAAQELVPFSKIL